MSDILDSKMIGNTPEAIVITIEPAHLVNNARPLS